MYPLQTFKYTRERTYEVDKFEKDKKEEDEETKEKKVEVKICKLQFSNIIFCIYIPEEELEAEDDEEML